jgi:hypothetical protein
MTALVVVSIIYPLLFVTFCLMALLSAINSIDRLSRFERVSFHLLLAILFAALALTNPVQPLFSTNTMRWIVRIVSLLLLLVSMPPVFRSIWTLARLQWTRKKDK